MRGAGPRLILRAEGAALAAAALIGYAHFGAGWWLFAVLLLVPDLSMLGYLAGARAGAAVYNAAHTTVLPLAVGVAGALTGAPLAVAVALVWLAHIGIDRALGYGLKHADGFGHTHLGMPGRR
jgi:hypothetical protein